MRLIDADKLIDQIKRRCHPYCDPDLSLNTSCEIISMICRMDSVDNWILEISDKPKDEEYVLVVLKHTYDSSDYIEYGVARYIELNDGKRYWCDNKHGYLEHQRYTDGMGGSSLYKVVAWKPIEPYALPMRKEKENE